MTIEKRIKLSDIIFQDIISYCAESIFNYPQHYGYFNNGVHVYMYLLENREFIDQRLLCPTIELYFDLTTTSYYEPKDMEKKYEDIRNNMAREKAKSME